MSDVLGPIVYGSEHDGDEVFLGRDFNTSRNYSEDTATLIDNEIKRIVNEAYETAMNLLTRNVDKLHFIAEFLMKNEVMDADQFAAAMQGGVTIEYLEEMAAEKKRKSESENEARERANAEEQARRDAEDADRERASSHKNDDEFPPEMKE